MSKAEEKAEEYEKGLDYFHLVNDWPSIAYKAGYEQAEKDLAYTHIKSIDNAEQAAVHYMEDCEEEISIKESPSKTFPRVNEFDCGSSYRH